MKQKAPETLTIEECEKLAIYFANYAPAYDGLRRAIRDSCMCLLMLDAGLRVGEVIAIPRGALSFLRNPVENIGITKDIAKKGSNRMVPVTSRLSASLASMQLNIWIPDSRDQDMTAFYNLANKHPLTKQAVGRIIRGAGWMALRRAIHPHMLRHTFATNLMRTTNSRVVQQLLGHKNLSSTQIYCHPDQQDLKKAIDSLPTTSSAAHEKK